ncbi:MAG TPA: hypothetical protein DEP51_05645 [Clostridiales bacterium]|nr:hypothetical protein [Clostridiales bacterium]
MKDCVENVLKNDNCVGCGLCSQMFQGYYGMQLTEQGFFRPKKFKEINNKELEETFKELCPGYIRRKELDSDKNIGIWGNYVSLVTGYSANEEIRYKASTGGTLTSVLLYLFDNKIIDKVLQVQANSSKPYISKYIITTTREDIINSIGSRYAPTFLFSQLNEIKNNKGKIAVVGKPCEIATLKRYVEKYEIEDKIFCYLSFFCGGTPSLNATLEILEKHNLNKNDITELKYRGEGWPGYFKAVNKNGETKKISYMDSWSKQLSKNIQNSCKICTDGIGEMADLVFGDAWNLNENGKPDFKEKKGVNFIFCRNKLGKEILDNAVKNNYVIIENKNLDDAILSKMQPYQAKHRKLVYYKILGKKICLRCVPKYPRKLFKNFSKSEKCKNKIKETLLSIKNELRKK